jgi:hypothetical protein
MNIIEVVRDSLTAVALVGMVFSFIIISVCSFLGGYLYGKVSHNRDTWLDRVLKASTHS